MIEGLKRRRWAIVIAIAAVAGLAAVAQAAIPDGAGTIHGCYKTNGGDLRVIDSATAQCKNAETALDWSQAGIPGPQGPQGAQGPQGPQGPAETGGITGWELVRKDFPLPSGTPGTAQENFVGCPAGKKVLGGGLTTTEWVDSTVRYSGPNTVGTAWHVIIQHTSGGDSPWDDPTTVRLYAICATVD